MIPIKKKKKGKKDYKCDFCGKSLTQAGSLKKHIHTIHAGHKNYDCAFCSKSFYQAGDLKRHMHTVHYGHKDNKCEYCGVSYSRKHNLKKHIHKIHKIHNDYNSGPRKLERHINTVGHIYKRMPEIHSQKIITKRIAYECDYCEKNFETQIQLRNHVIKECKKGGSDKDDVHEGNKKYEFEFCHTLPFPAGHLKRRIHTGKKENNCESSDKLFYQSSNLKIHINTVHKGHKDYKCDLC